MQMHPVLQAVTDTLKVDVDNSMKEGKFGVNIDSLIQLGQDTGVIFASEEGRKKWDVAALNTLAKKLFGVDLPKPVTANPRKEAELQVRYTLHNVVKQATSLAEIDVPKAFAEACEQTTKLLGNVWLLIDPDGSETVNEHTGEKIAATRQTGYVKGSGKTGRVKGQQQNKAAELFAANKDKPTKEIVALFMSQLKMTKAGATTYCYNCRKAAGLITPKAKKAAKKAKK
jgi:hypothetical protein